MKRILSLLLTIVLAPNLLPAATSDAVAPATAPATCAKNTAKTDGDGHVLVKLWQDYTKAEDADKPATAAAALQKIKAEAKRQHLTWDYFDAAEKYVNVGTRGNWKLRDSLHKAFRAEIEAFGEPVAVFYMRRGESSEELQKYLESNKKTLKAASHEEFWTRDWRLGRYKFSPVLKNQFKSDWDYCLWSLFPEKLMEQEYKSYPMNAFVEYQLACSGKNSSEEKPLKAFAEKWNGKAAALMAEEDLLQRRFNSLQEKGRSEDFKALRADCQALRTKAKAFKGDEKKIADCCVEADYLIAEMDAPSVSMDIKRSKLSLSLRNLEYVSVRIYKGDVQFDEKAEKKAEKVWEYLQRNPICSYYVPDDLLLDLPKLPDGTYTVKCVNGDTSESCLWEKYTISTASRWNGEGLGIWAADYISGEPIEKVDVDVLRDGKVYRSFNGLTLSGITTLPKEASNLFNDSDYKHSWSLRVRCGERASREVYPLSYHSPDISDRPDEMHCTILTDRSAFQPEETVHFKAIVWQGRYSVKASSGLKIKAILKDVQGRTIEELALTTSANGSVAGEFLLPRRERLGNYCLEIRSSDKLLSSKYILVDDFVLPTFDLVFDRTPELRFPLASVEIKGTVKAYSGHSLAGADISWKVEHNGDDWASGKLEPTKDRFALSFPTDSTDAGSWGSSYALTIKVIDATGETMEFQKWIHVAGRQEPARPPKEFFFEDLDDAFGTRIVAGSVRTWAVAELYGTGNVLLDRQLLQFEPASGTAAASGSPAGVAPAETTLRYDWPDSWPEGLSLIILYFQDGKAHQHTLNRSRKNHTLDLPLSFERFLDTTSPGAQYTFNIKTLAGAEVAVAVFDKSTERFMGNSWSSFAGQNRPRPSVYFNAICGQDSGSSRYMPFYSLGGNVRLMTKSASVNMMAMDSAAPEAMVEEEAAVSDVATGAATAEEIASDIVIREDFATTLAWEPFLRSDKAGNVSFSFTNSDKLSTYYVQVFAHDASMRNAALRREMVVTIPVKISLVEPQFLYEGDVWNVRIGLSSSLVGDVDGTLKIGILDGADRHSAAVLSSSVKRVTVPGGASTNFDFEVAVPVDIKDLGVLVSFTPDRIATAADGVFVSVPVHPAVQTLTEAHSAVLLPGADKAALEAQLRGLFENVDGSAAELTVRDIRQMLLEAIPSELEVPCPNAISLARALYAYSLMAGIPGAAEPSFDRESAISKLLACRDDDGGFAWFAGMSPSPIVTAVVLRLVRGLGIIDETAAVHYIDKEYFSGKYSWWRCLSMEQYLHTRSFFPEVSFTEKTSAEFRKAARAYLVPKKARGLNGYIAAKARRVQTLDNFLSLEGGVQLASKMGVRLGTVSRLRKSLVADVASLVEYAQPHRHGGVYYPNAVMPWRGLLETELDAHCALMAIMDRFGHQDISNGIRLWIMLQKETQNWKSGSGYLEALAAVLNGPSEVLETKVLALRAEYTVPFENVKAAGNEMSIAVGEPVVQRGGPKAGEAEVGAGEGEVGAGESPSVIAIGDRVKVRATLTSVENRSFVKVTIPFGAGLVPVNQISGYRWGYYRNVLSDRIELWYEVFPEEKTEIVEEFYATRAGSFQAPVATIVCEYAPHYRANDGWRGRLDIQPKTVSGAK